MNTKIGGFFLGILLVTGAVILLPASVMAFSLTGPIQPWMQATNGVFYPGSIGGPMELTNEYRWNVPVVTYGFDQSFLDFFGTNGVAAVEGAIQILNNLPSASQLELTNYPFSSNGVNYQADSQSLLDLKSQTLALLLQQLGLASPTHNIYVLKQWTPTLTTNSNDLLNEVFDGTNLSNYVVARNYDPESLAASPYVNHALYSGTIYDYSYEHYIIPIAADPLNNGYGAVDFFNSLLGTFIKSLTYDDAGGLRYLYSTNNINYETLLSDVRGVGTNENSYVDGAWRPGVDKITFVPQPIDPVSGAFSPMTNIYTDTYITNGILTQQELQRVTLKPDFVFSSEDVQTLPHPPFAIYSGTEAWMNEATPNGNTNGAGPGVIHPPVHEIFERLGKTYTSYYYYNTSEDQAFDNSVGWGSFDGSTNQIVTYPIPNLNTNQFTVRVFFSRLTNPNQPIASFDLKHASQLGASFTLQTSTNMVNWTGLFTVTNNGATCDYFDQISLDSSRFYRLIPE